MNSLSEAVLNILEDSHLGKMSIHVLTKQSEDEGIDLDKITENEIPRLSKRLGSVLPFFIGNEAQFVIMQINKLGNATG